MDCSFDNTVVLSVLRRKRALCWNQLWFQTQITRTTWKQRQIFLSLSYISAVLNEMACLSSKSWPKKHGIYCQRDSFFISVESVFMGPISNSFSQAEIVIIIRRTTTPTLDVFILSCHYFWFIRHSKYFHRYCIVVGVFCSLQMCYKKY